MNIRSTGALASLAGAAIATLAIQGLHAQSKLPVYVVTAVDIADLDAYTKEYLPVIQASIKASGGRLIAAGQNIVTFEGEPPGTRVAINQFDSLEAAQAWRASTGYKDARKIGEKYAKFRSYAVSGVPQ